jgi:predicted NBD/HSP70 family sugar kinase
MAERHLKGRSFAETQSAIFDLIRSSGQVSRNDLSERSGLTEATISKVVRTLLTEGYIIEAGYATSTGGKRPVLLELNTTSRYAVGITLDVAHIVYVLCDLGGHEVDSMSSHGIGAARAADVMKRVGGELHDFLDRRQVKKEQIIGVGVAAAGRVDSADGVLRLVRNPADWEAFAIQESLERSSGLSVVVENDANCAALGVFWSGRLPASHDFATIYMATGIGCGIVINGAIYRGASGNAGEIGHVVLDFEGPQCWCGARGCLEMLAAPTQVVRRAREDPRLAALLSDERQPDLRHDWVALGRAAAAGHAAASELLHRSARYLATALLGLVNTFDLDTLYLAGPGFAEAGEIYLSAIRDELARCAFMRSVHPVTVEISRVGDESAALGAASVALHGRLTPHHSAARLQPAFCGKLS